MPYTFKDPHKPGLRHALFLACVSAFYLIYDLGAGSIASWEEGVYASVALGILESGDALRLSLNGLPWSEKPPFFIWVTALLFDLFGVNELTARIFSAVCGVGTVLITYLIGCRLFGRWIGYLSALVLISSSHFLRFARFGMPDVPLLFMISLCVYFFLKGEERNRYLVFSGLALGAAVMTKGFWALTVLPAMWLYAAATGRAGLVGRSSYWVGVMLAVCMSLPWHLWEIWLRVSQGGTDYANHLGWVRTHDAFIRERNSPYFHIRTLINKYHPWILVGIVSAPVFLWRALRRRGEGEILCAAWIFLVLGYITLLPGKLPWHVILVYPPLSISVGWALARLFRENKTGLVTALFLLLMPLHIPYSNIFHQDYSRAIKGIAPMVLSHSQGGERLYLYDYHDGPAAYFYTGLVTQYIDDEKSFAKAAAEEPHFQCLVRRNKLHGLQPLLRRHGVRIAGSYGGVYYLRK